MFICKVSDEHGSNGKFIVDGLNAILYYKTRRFLLADDCHCDDADPNLFTERGLIRICPECFPVRAHEIPLKVFKVDGTSSVKRTKSSSGSNKRRRIEESLDNQTDVETSASNINAP